MAKYEWLLLGMVFMSGIIATFCTNGKTDIDPNHLCMHDLITPGYTVPHGDIYLEYGNPLDITCILNDEYMKENGDNASQNLYFLKDNHVLPSEMIEIINSSSIRLHIETPPESSSLYMCKLVNDTRAVCINRVIVGTKPLPVDDFNCIGYNYENLTCSWTPKPNFIKTSYNLTYYFPGRASRFIKNPCPKLIPSENKTMTCLWTLFSYPQYRQAQRTFYFELNITNMFGYIVVNKTFSHFKHVLSGPPINLTYASLTPESIYLHWSVPISMQVFPPGLEHRILHQSEYERNWQLANIIKTPSGEKTKSIYYNLTDLKYAHALYDIRVSMRSLSADSDDESMWSKNSSITVRTISKVPGKPPLTNIGSFEISPAGGNPELNDVYVYWQQIPETIKNGEDFEYDIEVVEQPDLKPDEKTNAYAKFQNLSISNQYTFNIWSKNRVGRSEQKATVRVPPHIKRVRAPTAFTKIAFGDGKYELSWEQIPGHIPVKNYTIYWCTHDRDRPYQCSGYLRWRVIPGGITIYNITVSDDEINQFAIAANSEDSTSGMVWAACTLLHNKVMGKMEQVWVNRVYSTAIELGWKLDCSDRIGSVEGYRIFYCSILSPTQLSCKDKEESKVIPGDSRTNRGTITGLIPYKTYMLSLAVLTKHSSQSQRSDFIYKTTLEQAPTPPQNITAITITNSSISLVWQKPNVTNGKLKNYKVNYYTFGTVPKRVIADYEAYTLTNLTSFVDHYISVEACTVECSEGSPLLKVRTEGGYPSVIHQPGVTFQNGSTIVVSWLRPLYPRGNINFYEVSFKKKLNSDNDTSITNTTENLFFIDNCGEDGKYNSFYISVRAINIFNETFYKGPWSEELSYYCETSSNLWYWTLIPAGFILVLVLFYFGKRCYLHCKDMRDVEVKLPSGLAPVVTTDIGLSNWGGPKIQEEQNNHPSADEELLLVKFPNTGNLSGDSSGCSSGHESVTSSLESGTHLSSTSDSGTEQPRSSSTEDLHKNSLRLRNVSVNRPTKGYVTVPPDNQNVPTRNPKTAAPGNYCVLGVDPTPITSINPNYIPAQVPQSDSKLPYILPNASTQSSPYVVTGDLNKPSNSGYVPLNSVESNEKSSPYVMAGNKGIIVPDLMRLDSVKSTTDLENTKPGYVQVAEAKTNLRKATPDDFSRHQLSTDTVPLKTGYVTVGDTPGSLNIIDPSKGYIPHRQFDTKTIKED